MDYLSLLYCMYIIHIYILYTSYTALIKHNIIRVSDDSYDQLWYNLRRRPLSAYSVRAKTAYCTVYAHLMFTGNVTIYTAMINNFIQTGNRPYRLIRFVQGWGHSICNIGASKCYRPFIGSMLLVRGSR